MFAISPETSDDASAIETLLDKSFGPGRYAKTAYRLREGVKPLAELSLVARDETRLVGSIRFWPIVIGVQRAPALLLGPLAVEPTLKGKGIGVALMSEGLKRAKERGDRIVVLVGDEPYYARVGFKRVPEGRLQMPGPVDTSRLLFTELVSGSFAGLEGAIARPF